jgi:hypothetical protein
MKRLPLSLQEEILGRHWLNARTFGFPDMVTLFHGLAGFCIGGLRGMRYSTLADIGLCLVGTVVGFLAGFLVAHVPRFVNRGVARMFPGNRFLAAVLAISGYSFWLGLGIAFWWGCFTLLGR